MKRVTALAAVLFILPWFEPLQARQPATVSWAAIPAFAGDKQIEIRDSGGRRWKGRVVSVDPDALTIDERDKGRTAIPRASVQTIRLKKRGTLWTIVGTSVGAAIGIGLGAFVNTYSHNEGDGAPAATAAAVAIPAGLGFLLGFAADSRHKDTVRVID